MRHHRAARFQVISAVLGSPGCLPTAWSTWCENEAQGEFALSVAARALSYYEELWGWCLGKTTPFQARWQWWRRCMMFLELHDGVFTKWCFLDCFSANSHPRKRTNDMWPIITSVSKCDSALPISAVKRWLVVPSSSSSYDQDEPR